MDKLKLTLIHFPKNQAIILKKTNLLKPSQNSRLLKSLTIENLIKLHFALVLKPRMISRTPKNCMLFVNLKERILIDMPKTKMKGQKLKPNLQTPVKCNNCSPKMISGNNKKPRKC